MIVPPVVFADAGYYIARFASPDAERRRAVAWRKYVQSKRIRIVTTEAVLWEWMNYFARRGREAVHEGYQRLHADPRVDVIPFDAGLVTEATKMYGNRPDQEWGVTDCLSFIVMKRRELTAALAFDQHFVQAGFQALLLDDPPE